MGVDAERTFTWQELATHNTKGDLFVAVRGNVYDVTKFLKRHPGGDDTLLLGAGRDVTPVFEMYHEFGVVDTIMKKYYVGKLITNELPIFPEPTDFHRAVKTRVEGYFKKQGKDPKNRPEIWGRYFLIFGTLFASYYAQFFVPFVVERTWLQVIFAIILGFCCAQVGLNPLHDASHFSVTHNPTVWKILGATHDFFNGASYLVWLYQHMLGHHPYTNIAGADPDVATAERDVRRIKPHQKWFINHVNQHLFVPFLYGLLAFKTRFQDISILYFVKANDAIRVNPLSPWHTAMFWGGKAFFFWYRLILPLQYLPVRKVLLLFTVADMISSYWLALTFQANHVVEEVEWPLPDENGVIQKDWAAMQVETTQDYAHDSYIWTSITGSLNYQAVHHLFPNVSQHYYPEILFIIRQACIEYKIPYLVKDTFWQAFSSHLEHLRVLGLRPKAE
ncbi:delta-5 desaturase [Gamsiella multidivaricata]|uniref:delta-5 desaturase n=1 Tax=Gamsiella multidivaricata TaxID=101098 RepID=UPI00221FAE27|nr:delta-5 desaturase [Gamsiella multidivaricata]KAG0366873.1 sphingolipid delta-4 desaturase [Gamsiella multidivaricata]KAI7823509.1 delta-5 desaturase [Gamsiella multidivaricata]